jgi:predicted ribosome quality control (RQC) complex YloA/Tae2 family protein
MIQYYLDLEQQVRSIRDLSLPYAQIQKIYSTAYYISFSLRAPGKTWHLYFGRGSGFEGVWLHDAPPPSELRRKDTFLEYLRRHLSSCSLIDLALDEHDRICQLTYQKYGTEQAFLWFWKGRKLYFAHYYQDTPESPMKLLLSWRGKAFSPGEDLGNLYDVFDDVGRNREMKHDFQSPLIPSMSDLLDEELKAASFKKATSGPTFLQRKKENIEDDLRKAKQWEKLQSILDRGETLEGHELRVGDHKIKFEGELNPYERRNLLFQKIKKLKRGESILQERLGHVQEELLGTSTKEVVQSEVPIIRPVWGEEKTTTLRPPVRSESEGYKVFRTGEFQIGVGLSAQGNDQLRNKWASKDDLWLHLDGQKSTHVIIKLSTGQIPGQDVLNLGASIVAHFSHFHDDWIPIIHTQVKNLKGVPGASGMVTYKKEKHLRCPRLDIHHLIKE